MKNLIKYTSFIGFLLFHLMTFAQEVVHAPGCEPSYSCTALKGGNITYYVYWIDSDGDGIGSSNDPNDFICTLSDTAPSGYAYYCHDCDDENSNATTFENWYPDNDGDGYGAGTPTYACGEPSNGNYVTNNSDCDDNDPTIHGTTTWYIDNDGDGYGSSSSTQQSCFQPNGYVDNDDDCDDNDSSITVYTYYLDGDGDGYGNPDITTTGCTPPSGYVTNNTDCDDNNPFLNPGTNWYPDNDGDGYGNHNAPPIQGCERPSGYVRGQHDCNDNNAAYHPGTIWYLDADGDGYGESAENFLVQCTRPLGYVLNLAPVEPIDEETLPNYPNLDINDLTYVHTIEPFVPVTSIPALDNLTDDDKGESIVYYDGMGRPMQQIAMHQGGFKEDIVGHIEYDRFGRTTKNYLNYGIKSIPSGRYRINASQETRNFYASPKIQNTYVTVDDPYSESVFERSPLSRLSREGAPGDSWKIGSGHEVKKDYKLNKPNDVRFFEVHLSPSLSPSIIDNGSFYPVNELAISIVKDENWTSGVNNTIEEYRNKDGQVVLKRTYADGIRLSTYYVYDIYDNLTYVIPPKANPDSNTIDQSVLNELCFQHRYDALRRQIRSKSPDVNGWEAVIYDTEDRPILVKNSGTGPGKWIFTKYDKYGRIVYTGIYTSSLTKTSEDLQAEADTYLNIAALPHYEQRGMSTIDGITIGYTNQAYPKNDIEILSVNYYDDYSFLDPDKPIIPTEILGKTVTQNVKKLGVANWVRTINADSWNKTYSFYDEQGRLLRDYNINHLGGYTKIDSKLDFRGRTMKNVTYQKRVTTDSELVVAERYVYDHAERVRATYQVVNGHPEKLINGFVYDAIGKLLVKYVEPESEDFGFEWVPGLLDGPSTNLVLQLKDINTLQKTDYRYNEKGNLIRVNDPSKLLDDVFALKLNYDKIESSIRALDEDYQPTFNGNISQMFWASKNDEVVRDYRYKYDALNRLKKAKFSNNDYSLTNVKYDKNGNITELNRNTQNGNQNFDYTYNGNKLVSLGGSETVDGTSSIVNRVYTYDNNGNLKSDSSKDITNIEYNHLNLPERVSFATGQIIEYDYSASGVKLQKRFILGTTTHTTDYINGFQYVEEELQFFGQPEGYVIFTSGTGGGGEIIEYVHNFIDHLGNIRLSYSDIDDSGAIDLGNELVKENNYYPFGMLHKGYNEYIDPLGSIFNYGFNGKELQEENEIAWLDFGSRNYDSELGRWFNTDPENQFNSPYLFSFNNPINSIDPDGEEAFTVVAVIVGAAIVGASATAIANPRADFTDIFSGAIIGAFSGVITYGIGSAVGGLTTTATVATTTGVSVSIQVPLSAGTQLLISSGAHALFQGGLAAVQGGDFWQASLAAGASSVVGGTLSQAPVLAQIGGSAVVGGFISEASGGDFKEGFVTGLTVASFNHALHRGAMSLQKLKFNKEVNAAYGAKADSPAPCSDGTICEVVENVPTLKKTYSNFDGNVPLRSSQKFTSSKGSDALTYTYGDGKVAVTVFKASFNSYRILAQTLYHEFQHVNQFQSGLFNSTVTKFKAKFGNTKGAELGESLMEVKAYQATFRVTGQQYTPTYYTHLKSLEKNGVKF